MKNKKLLPLIILLFIFGTGLFLRLYRLDQNLPPLYADETGQYFVFHSIINRSTSLIRYLINLTFSFTWFLGLTPLGVRLPSALYGSAMIVLAYFLGLCISRGNQKISLVYAGLVATAPWSFMISRIGHTHIPIMLLFVCLHVYLYLKAQKIADYLISMIPLVLAIIYYPTVIFIVPFISVHLMVMVFKKITQKGRWLFSISFLLIAVCLVAAMSGHFKFFSTSGRGLDLAIWRDVNTTYQTDQYRALSWNSSPSIFSFYLPVEKLADKLVYNRVSANIGIFTRNYLSFFSPDWLFLSGDNIRRHSTGQVGAFYLFLLPFMIYGTFVFFKTSSPKNKVVFLIWILASPISAAITKDGPGYLLRVVTLLPFLTYLCATGIVESFGLIKKAWKIPYGFSILIIGLYSFYYFFFGYFHVYPALSARSYEYGFKELSDFQVSQNNSSMLIVWDGYYHNNDFRFWQKTPIDETNAFKLKDIPVGQSHFYQTFPNLYFVNPKTVQDLDLFIREFNPQYLVLPDRYFLNYPVEIDKEYSLPLETIQYPDKTPALKIFQIKKVK